MTEAAFRRSQGRHGSVVHDDHFELFNGKTLSLQPAEAGPKPFGILEYRDDDADDKWLLHGSVIRESVDWLCYLRRGRSFHTGLPNSSIACSQVRFSRQLSTR